MKAMIIEEAGAPEVFQERDIVLGPLSPDAVRLRVLATSVNPIDCKIRGLGLPFGPAYPAVLHGDVVGEVTAIGSHVTQFEVGQRVFGCAGGVKNSAGALAEFMDCDPDLLALAPSNCDARMAAALPLVSITAWEALIDKAAVRHGMTVLVHGGTGGVGHVAVQLAKARGARVFATVSSEQKAALVAEMGATPILYPEMDVEAYVEAHTQGAGFDVVFDTVGGENIPLSWKAARAGGHVVSCQSNSQQDLGPVHLKALTHSAVLMLLPLLTGKRRVHHGAILEEIAAMVQNGTLTPLLDNTDYSLDQIAQAHQRQESGDAVGKVVVSVASL